MSGKKNTAQVVAATETHRGVDVMVSDHHDRTIVATILHPDAAAKPAPMKVSEESTGEIVEWGSSNDDPKKWRLKVEDSSTALPLIFKKSQLMYGLGIVYYLEKKENGVVTQNYESIAELDEFLENNEIDFLILQRLQDYNFFNNLFCEYILSSGEEKKILNISHLEAEFCRFSKPDENNDIKKIHYAGKWPEKKGKTEIDFVHRSKISQESLKGLEKFASHISFPVPGRTLYSIPMHYAILKDGNWLDYSNDVPRIMSAINKNVMDIRWHIQIPYSYWTTLYQDWEQKTELDRKKIVDQKLTEMHNFLTGKENAGKAFISHYAIDPITGKEVSGWKIESLDDPGKKDKFITSLQESDIQIARAVGMDVSLAGIQPAGGKMGAGSGSDKRTAFNNQVSLAASEMRIILAPLYHAKKINGWPSELKFAIEYSIPTTLNENKSGTNQIIQ